ncbi:hypothetical protein [Micromonospora sp. C95]|uniref:hypothetical protein n=1 Tax=Micromonospora sp. C95 TaxID=2824882 RepID=UPI001B38FB6E|nr:hypothetical protein [Micromonospora sp. C95]MBQ1027850.1 hypothetical protein [Micromonospora sp. C95]
MPTETALNAADPSHRVSGGAPDRSTRTWQLVGISTLAGVIALASIAVPWLLTPDESRPDGTAAPAATGNQTVPPPSATASPLATSVGPASQLTTAATGPNAANGGPISKPAPGQSARPVTTAPPPVAAAPPPSPSAEPDGSSGTLPFRPASVEAEDPANLLTEGAGIAVCGACEGGARVRYVGRLTAYLTTATAGSRTITVSYTVNGERSIQISINGAAPTTHRLTGTDWDIPRTFRYTATVPAGRVSMAFYNDAGPAPDIDKITIS